MDKMKSPEAAMAASAVVGTVAMVQLLTDWDPLGRCFTFVKQLRGHVRVIGWLVLVIGWSLWLVGPCASLCLCVFE
jgi:hypothetical protein